MIHMNYIWNERERKSERASGRASEKEKNMLIHWSQVKIPHIFLSSGRIAYTACIHKFVRLCVCADACAYVCLFCIEIGLHRLHFSMCNQKLLANQKMKWCEMHENEHISNCIGRWDLSNSMANHSYLRFFASSSSSLRHKFRGCWRVSTSKKSTFYGTKRWLVGIK